MNNDKAAKYNSSGGFSVLELIIAMTLTLILMAIATSLFSGALSSRDRESRRTDALTLAQTSLNVMSREIANTGFGLTDNGIVLADSGQKKLHFRSNIVNSDSTTSDAGEDVTYYYDSASRSIFRSDRFDSPQTSVVVPGMSDLNFQYFDYSGSSSTPVVSGVPSANTGRIRITMTIELRAVQGQPAQSVTYTTDVTLRNSSYILKQY